MLSVISILVEEKVEPKKTEKVWTAGEVREVEGGDLIIFFMIKVMLTKKIIFGFCYRFLLLWTSKQTNKQSYSLFHKK